MMDILMFAGFVVLASTFAIGMWALGRWLRSRATDHSSIGWIANTRPCSFE